MAKCKHCEEDITWIDGRPFSLQSHFKVCRPNGVQVKKKPVFGPNHDALAYDALMRLGYKSQEAHDMLDKAQGGTSEELVASALQQSGKRE